jgi:tRNA(Ile)-lysidine synthase
LSVKKLQSLPEVQCRNLIRYWLQTLNLPIPSYAITTQIIDTVVHARADAESLVRWPGAEIRRHGDEIHASEPLSEHDPNRIYRWDMASPLIIEGIGRLKLVSGHNVGLNVDRLQSKEISVQFRKGGERCRLAGNQQTKTLKNLFQQWRIPAWLRERVPLLYADDEIAAIVGYAICEGYRVTMRDKVPSVMNLELMRDRRQQ